MRSKKLINNKFPETRFSHEIILGFTSEKKKCNSLFYFLKQKILRQVLSNSDIRYKNKKKPYYLFF